MKRLSMIAMAVLLVAGPAAFAQSQQIQWLQNAQDGVALARQHNRPIMFYVIGSKEDRPNDEDEHRRSFQDSTVLRLSKNFVPVRIKRALNKELAREWGLGDSALDLVFTGPDGKLIDTLSSGGIARPTSLANKMHLVFDRFRNEYYAAELKPVLENPEAAPADLRKAVQTVDEMIIARADGALVKLLERDKLDAGLKKLTLSALATLSTPEAVKALVKLAPTDKLAADALNDCTPVAAEQSLLPLLSSSEEAERLLAYKTAAKICKVRDPKPDRFWGGKNEQIKKAELERIQKLVQRAAEDWKRRYEYR